MGVAGWGASQCISVQLAVSCGLFGLKLAAALEFRTRGLVVSSSMLVQWDVVTSEVILSGLHFLFISLVALPCQHSGMNLSVALLLSSKTDVPAGLT